jgi:hypothetical protein
MLINPMPRFCNSSNLSNNASLHDDRHEFAHFDSIRCEKWIVVTSIFPPSSTVQEFASLSASGWCLVVVGDLSGPPTASFDSLLQVANC